LLGWHEVAHWLGYDEEGVRELGLLFSSQSSCTPPADGVLGEITAHFDKPNCHGLIALDDDAKALERPFICINPLTLQGG